MIKALLRLVTVAAVAATTLLAPASAGTAGSAAQAADTRLFDAGNIISDAVFFDSRAMDAPAIQQFLDAKGSGCTDGAVPCLKNYRADTVNQNRDAYCAGYSGAARESAATIIAKVAESCGISPRVLLVLLDKEQSLVSRQSATVYAYEHATGMGCPDAQACNPAFAGFVAQVYFAARQYQKYRVDASSYRYKAGRTNTIGYAPATAEYNNIGNARCGTTDVFIANQATAGLYNYTPYVPNRASLDAQRGTGDSCSTYGNRNFWNFFTTWFGSTQSAGAAEILKAYQAMGGTSSWLGAVTSGYVCGLSNGGCFQAYQGGSIYWSPASGAHAVRGVIAAAWGASGWEKGWLGYPTGEEVCGLAKGGCLQLYQGAAMYYSPATGAQPVESAIAAGYQAQGWENGPLGYPLARQICGLVNGGCFQDYQGGAVYWSKATGAHPVRGPVQRTWGALGWERGWLGYPTGEDDCTTSSTSCKQQYQGGTMYWTPSTGAHPVRGDVAARWVALGGITGTLGAPTGSEICGLVNGGCFQTFANGNMYWSPATGAHPVRGAVQSTWGALGWERGWLGYPTGEDDCTTSSTSCKQQYQGGTMYWTPSTGAHPVRGDVAAGWVALGGITSTLGPPTGSEICGLVNGGCFQTFANGSMYWSPATGARPVEGPIRDAWGSAGWEIGTLGYPVEAAHAVAGGVAQRFQGGILTLNATTGVVTRT